MKKQFLILILISLINSEILYTAELHGTLDYGLITKSAGIKGLKQKLESNEENILLDGGGFLAGGLYDATQKGRKQDSIISIKVLEELKNIKYDALAIGDEELQFGASFLKKYGDSLPFVSLNIKSDIQNVIKPFLIKKRDGVRFLITALTTNEKILLSGNGFKRISLKESLKLLSETGYDSLIIMAHLSKIELDSITSILPKKSLILNSHRNKKGFPNFGFEGSYILSYNGDRIDKINNISKNKHNLKQEKDYYQIFIMSGCPYGASGLLDIIEKCEKSGAIYEFVFTGSDENGILKTGLSSGSIKEESIILAVSKLYPNIFQDFIWLIINSNISAEDALGEMKLDIEKITSWIDINAKKILRQNYRLSTYMGVEVSPTLFKNNKLPEKEIEKEALLDKVTDAKLYLPKFYNPNIVDEVMNDMLFLFPNLNIKVLSYNLEKDPKFKRIPALTFDSTIINCYNFHKIERFLKPFSGELVILDSIMGGTYYPQREINEKNITLVTKIDLPNLSNKYNKIDTVLNAKNSFLNDIEVETPFYILYENREIIPFVDFEELDLILKEL